MLSFHWVWRRDYAADEEELDAPLEEPESELPEPEAAPPERESVR